jgi:murein DD-endopeptidase MepM/ murein hydrolase activator NlpD
VSRDTAEKPSGGGYGNIYTPHAGSMIIHVQRESGLANRTIVLSERKFRLLRRTAWILGSILAIMALSWAFLASQALRVPHLTQRIASLQRDVQRLDTLQAALTQLEGRFHQVQNMLGAAPPPPPPVASDTSGLTLPSQWPLAARWTALKGHDGGPDHRGIDLAVPPGTPVRAVGGAIVVEVAIDPLLGQMIRLKHADGYESIYANISGLRVAKGDHVATGAIIALSGGPTDSLPPHLHFELRLNGQTIDPSTLARK